MNRMICERCKKEYEPPYLTQRLKDKSIYCPTCVDEMCKEMEKKHQETRRKHNFHPTMPKFGYEFVHGWDEYKRLGGHR